MLVDLRSDTVTKPSETMRRAMAAAEVGDVFYRDDPTVNRLQDRAAEVTGMDAVLYVPTGSMANRIAHHVLVRPGHMVVCERFSHVNTVELQSAAVLSGITYRGVPSEGGRLTAEAVAEALIPDPFDMRVMDLVSIENTHQLGGGAVLPVDEVRAIRKVADDAGVALYLDGARIFNASVAGGTPVTEYAREVLAMMFCLSKGLGAPVGSVLCGGEDFIAEARRTQLLFGGIWRQAGILAAAGIVALEEGPGRLHEDHARARRLAEGIEEATPGAVDLDAVETNIVFADVAPLGLAATDVVARLRDEGVLCNPVGAKVRFVTHLDVDDRGIDRALDAWRALA